MSLSRLLSSGAFNRLSPVAGDLAFNPEALKALDKQLLHSAKQTGPVSKFMPAYGKYVAKPTSITGSAFYGRKMDMPKILATLGGEAARPMFSYLHNAGNLINEAAMNSTTYSKFAPDSVLNIMKPGIALTSKPLMALDGALGGALHMAENPILASIALPITAYGALKGGSALMSRLGRGRRLAQLRKGIAPRAYQQQARQLGYK
jgi:hypothetical protein